MDGVAFKVYCVYIHLSFTTSVNTMVFEAAVCVLMFTVTK